MLEFGSGEEKEPEKYLELVMLQGEFAVVRFEREPSLEAEEIQEGMDLVGG